MQISFREFPHWRVSAMVLAMLLTSKVSLAQERPLTRPAPTDPSKTSSEEDPRANRKLPQKKGDITFDTLKFDIEKDGKFERKMLTQEIEALNDREVTIRGFILPASVMQLRNIKKFVLVRDNQECCFGPGAAIYDCVMIEMVGEASAEFTTRPVAVTGKFRVKEFKYPDDEGHYAIYQIRATEVK